MKLISLTKSCRGCHIIDLGFDSTANTSNFSNVIDVKVSILRIFRGYVNLSVSAVMNIAVVIGNFSVLKYILYWSNLKWGFSLWVTEGRWQLIREKTDMKPNLVWPLKANLELNGVS